MDDLSTVLDSLHLETKPRTNKAKLTFSADALTQDELDSVAWEYCNECNSPATEYQYRALAVLQDSFYQKAIKKHSPEFHSADTCILALAEYQPMFNEIHRAVAHYVAKGLSVHEALVLHLKPAR